MKMIKHVKNFAWGMGGFMVMAVCAYLANISDIREIGLGRIETILVVSASGYILNAVTKKFNKLKK